MVRPVIEPGIYFGMDEERYHAAEGLSCSGMKHLAVSPLNYWHQNLNPDREPRQDTEAFRFGKAAHCIGLEPARFAERYALKLSPDDFPGALETADDMKAFLAANGLPKTAKRKQDLIERIVASGIPAVIWEHELARHGAANAGKVLLGAKESALIKRAGEVLANDPYASSALTGGMPEVSFFVRDPDTGVMLKARMDYVKPKSTIDLKTFSNSRCKPTIKAVYDSIYYENYHLQCVVYHTVRELARLQMASGEIRTHGDVPEEWLKGFAECAGHGFGFVFIESSEPFDLEIVQLRPSEVPGADLNVYWNIAAMQMYDLTHTYRECSEKYGDTPWREVKKPRVLSDTDIPQLMFS